jgi:hypothetical protein
VTLQETVAAPSLDRPTRTGEWFANLAELKVALDGKGHLVAIVEKVASGINGANVCISKKNEPQ